MSTIKQETTVKSNVGSGGLNVRSAPTLSANSVGKLYANNVVVGVGNLVQAEGHKWLNTTYPIAGWCATDWFTEIITTIVPDPNPIPDGDFPPSVWLSLTEDGERQEYIIVEE